MPPSTAVIAMVAVNKTHILSQYPTNQGARRTGAPAATTSGSGFRIFAQLDFQSKRYKCIYKLIIPVS